MKAPVPPGYTRGPILFLGDRQTAIGEVDLLQRFWSESGAYGARLLLVATPESAPNLTHLSPLFTEWGIDSLATLKLVSFLEERFKIQLAAHEANPANFDSLSSIAALVERKQKVS